MDRIRPISSLNSRAWKVIIKFCWLDETFTQARQLFNDPNLVLDSHKAFIVKYALGEDTELAEHFDNAEVTLNVAISQDYEGGELVFKNSTGNNLMFSTNLPVFDRDFTSWS